MKSPENSFTSMVCINVLCVYHLPSEWQNPFLFLTPSPFFLTKPQIPLYRSCYKAKILGLLGNTHFPKPTTKTRRLSKNIATPGWQCSQRAQLLVVVVGNFPIANPLLFHFFKASQTFQLLLLLQAQVSIHTGGYTEHLVLFYLTT